MSEWWVNLRGDEFDLGQLTTLLKTPDCCVRQEEGRYFLTADRLNNLGNADEVRAAAEAIVHSLNGLVRLRLNARKPILVGNMEERVQDDKTKHMYAMPESESLWLRGSVVGVLITEGGTNKPVEHQEDPLGSWFSLSESDQTVARVLRMYGEVVQPWKDLYPIYEIIQDDVGGEAGVVSKGWTSRNQIERFRRTACHPEAAGEGARHGVSSADPPPNPMIPSDAIEFIDSLMHQWLAFKQQSKQMT